MPGVSGKMAVLEGAGRAFHLLALSPLFSMKSDSQHFSLSLMGFGELQLCLLAYTTLEYCTWMKDLVIMQSHVFLNHKTRRS